MNKEMKRYNKLNSFIDFSGKYDEKIESVLKKIASIFDGKKLNQSYSSYELEILERVLGDLFSEKDHF